MTSSPHIASSASAPKQAELLAHLKFENRLRPFQLAARPLIIHFT